MTVFGNIEEIPGTIFDDYESFTDYIINNEVVLTLKSQNLKISGDHTLLNLKEAIHESFDIFDYRDHLYSFYMSRKPYSGDSYSSLESGDLHTVEEVTIAELDLNIGQRFIYLYDYGNSQVFKIVVEDIQEEGEELAEPEIINK